MPKTGMQPIRRRQLIAATIATIEAHGFAETTIARISQTAGMSSGIINHYFGGKNALLAATMRSLLTDLQREMIARKRRAVTPVDRVEAIIGASFARQQFTPRVCAAWVSFYAQVPYSPELSRLYRVYLRRLRSNLRHALRPLVTSGSAEQAAEGMSALIDGIWVRAALAEWRPDLARARALAGHYLDCLLAREQIDAAAPPAAAPAATALQAGARADMH